MNKYELRINKHLGHDVFWIVEKSTGKLMAYSSDKEAAQTIVNALNYEPTFAEG